MYELVHNICGEKYREFILYCLKHSTLFHLQSHRISAGKKLPAFGNWMDLYIRQLRHTDGTIIRFWKNR